MTDVGVYFAYIHNFRTGVDESHASGWIPETDAEALDYLPQHRFAAAVYVARRRRHDSIADAMEYVLRVYAADAR